MLHATGPVPLDLGAELLSDLGIAELAAGINERRDGGIPHRKEQILDLPWPRHRRSVLNFSVSVMTAENSPNPALHSNAGTSGTGSSNPACSSGESSANLSFAAAPGRPAGKASSPTRAVYLPALTAVPLAIELPPPLAK